MAFTPNAFPAVRISKADLDETHTHIKAAQLRARDIIDEAERTAAEVLSHSEKEQNRRTEEFEVNKKSSLREFMKSKEIDNQIDAIVTLSLQAKQIKDEFDSLKPWLIDFVIATTRKILGSLPKDDVIAGLVSEAVTMCPLNDGLKLKVNQSEKVSINDAMIAFPNAFAGITDVIYDATMQPDTILLEGIGGFMDISQNAQLSVLRSHLENQFTERSDDA